MTPSSKALKSKLMIKRGDSEPDTYEMGGKTIKGSPMTPKEAGFGVERRNNVNWKKLAEMAKEKGRETKMTGSGSAKAILSLLPMFKGNAVLKGAVHPGKAKIFRKEGGPK